MTDLMTFVTSDGTTTLVMKFASLAQGFLSVVPYTFRSGVDSGFFLSLILLLSASSVVILLVVPIIVAVVVVAVMTVVALLVVVVMVGGSLIVQFPFKLIVFHFSV